MMAEPATEPRPTSTAHPQDEGEGDLLAYDSDTEEDLDAFADALAGLPD